MRELEASLAALRAAVDDYAARRRGKPGARSRVATRLPAFAKRGGPAASAAAAVGAKLAALWRALAAKVAALERTTERR